MTIQLTFKGIDSFNRPVFTDGKEYYGLIDNLFDFDAKEKEVLGSIDQKDLVYFGTSFDCEPVGSKPRVPVVIVGAPVLLDFHKLNPEQQKVALAYGYKDMFATAPTIKDGADRTMVMIESLPKDQRIVAITAVQMFVNTLAVDSALKNN